MSASNKIGDRFVAAAQVAGVLATAWFVWITAILPRLGLESLAGIAAQSLFYVTIAWICAGVVTFWVYLVVSLSDLPRVARFSLRTAAPAMWFAPAFVLLSTPFAAAFAVSVFLVANATRHLVSGWASIGTPVHPAEAASTEPAPLFRTAGPDAAFLSWNSAPVLMGSFTAQMGLVALLWRHRSLAAALLALSTAILTSLSIATGAYRPGKLPALPHSALSVVWTFLLAAALTFGGIAVRGRGGSGAQAASDSPDPGGKSGSQRVAQAAAPPVESSGFGGDFPGVILLPALQPHTTLVAPVPAAPAKFGAPLLTPRGIPFTGEYWMFRWPATRPPPGAAIRRGSASELSFHTTDGWPMEMEAHQKLDLPIDIKCCSQIQLAIQDTDQFPGTVSLELVLIDTQFRGLPQSLGTVAAGSPSAAVQVLTFRIPPVTVVRKFDEIKVVFRRATLRADKSARISIWRFVLIP
ncbi:MAG: hypothetical protein ABSH24_30175 [Bryobacteraceae bacterium]